MQRNVQVVVFTSFIFIVFLALNYFIFNIMGYLLNLSSFTVYSLVLLLAISYPAAALLERTVSHALTRAFYTISSAWMGISIFLVILLVGYEILNIFFIIPPYKAGLAIIAITSIISAYSILNSISIEIKNVELNIPNLKRNVKIVQLSDIHIGSVRNSGFMKKIVKKTNELNPDIVLITGDTVDGSAKVYPHMFDALNNINAPVFLIIGNHEVYEGLENVLPVLKTININILRDEMVEIEGIQIIGVDYSFNKNHLKDILSKIEIDRLKPSILMYHVPSEVEAANEAGINLQISGHTHKGQIFPFNLMGRLAFPYFSGLYNHKDTQIYVSQGTGTWGPPMRLGSRNEITVHNLLKSNKY